MPCSGCSALHGVNPNLNKKQQQQKKPVMFEVAKIVNQHAIESHLSAPEDGTYLSLNDLVLG